MDLPGARQEVARSGRRIKQNLRFRARVSDRDPVVLKLEPLNSRF
jgi:hypothetical protein